MSSSRADIVRFINEAEEGARSRTIIRPKCPRYSSTNQIFNASAGYTFLFDMLLKEHGAKFSDIEKREEVIKGVDGNDIKLFISTPTGSGPFPCLYHTHGGGMAFQMAEDLCYTMIRDMYVRHVSRALIGAMSSDSL